MTATSTRGRPRSVDDAQILDLALASFATLGYHATSIRALNEQLGLSHQAIGQRFGSKHALFVATFDHGMRSFATALDEELARAPEPIDDVSTLRALIIAFIRATRRNPELGRVINHEGLEESERLDHIIDALAIATEPFAELIIAMIAGGTIRPTTMREIFFLVQAGGAPFNLAPLSRAFDGTDGPLEPEDHIENVTGIILRGLLA